MKGLLYRVFVHMCTSSSYWGRTTKSKYTQMRIKNIPTLSKELTIRSIHILKSPMPWMIFLGYGVLRIKRLSTNVKWHLPLAVGSLNSINVKCEMWDGSVQFWIECWYECKCVYLSFLILILSAIGFLWSTNNFRKR